MDVFMTWIELIKWMSFDIGFLKDRIWCFLDIGLRSDVKVLISWPLSGGFRPQGFYLRCLGVIPGFPVLFHATEYVRKKRRKETPLRLCFLMYFVAGNIKLTLGIISESYPRC